MTSIGMDENKTRHEVWFHMGVTVELTEDGWRRFGKGRRSEAVSDALADGRALVDGGSLIPWLVMEEMGFGPEEDEINLPRCRICQASEKVEDRGLNAWDDEGLLRRLWSDLGEGGGDEAAVNAGRSALAVVWLHLNGFGDAGPGRVPEFRDRTEDGFVEWCREVEDMYVSGEICNVNDKKEEN